MRHPKTTRLLLQVSATLLAFALGRLVYHYVLFQGTCLLLIDF
jgi:hypothetical protein